jgi:hypothetical protein
MKSINMVSDSVCATSKPLKGRRDQFWLIATSATTKRHDKSFFFWKVNSLKTEESLVLPLLSAYLVSILSPHN